MTPLTDLTKIEQQEVPECDTARRNVLKKTAAFAIPTLVTFSVSSLAMPASGEPDLPPTEPEP